MTDEPLVLQPAVRKLEMEAIALYRAKYADGLPWQELADSTRHMWVVYAEFQRGNAGVTPCEPSSTAWGSTGWCMKPGCPKCYPKARPAGVSASDGKPDRAALSAVPPTVKE